MVGIMIAFVHASGPFSPPGRRELPRGLPGEHSAWKMPGDRRVSGPAPTAVPAWVTNTPIFITWLQVSGSHLIGRRLAVCDPVLPLGSMKLYGRMLSLGEPLPQLHQQL